MTASTQTFGNTFPTLVDVLKRLDPNGTIAQIANTLTKVNPILADMTWQEGNLPDGHKFTSTTALPSLTWRKYNQGVDPSKGTTDQHTETCGMLEGYSAVDTDLAKLNGNEAAYRASEDKLFVTSFDNTISTALFYASAVKNPEQFDGLSTRYATTTNNIAASGGVTGTGQIIKADSAASGADQTSIWLVGYSPETVFGIYPKGSVGGLQHQDLGTQLWTDSNSKRFTAYVSKWQWKLGLCVRDYRYLVRICNIDTSTWTADLSAGADIAMNMISAISQIFNIKLCRPVFYSSRAAFNMLAQQLVARQANWLQYIDEGGVLVPHFYGVPVRFCDALTITEAVVS